MNLLKCYMCSQPAITVEHVPPKCLFPQMKETNGVDFRRNLITVPACNLHNCSKSNDDEFLMVAIAGIIGNNSIGYNHYAHGKVQRALVRSSGKLLENVFTKKYCVNIQVDKNKFIKAIAGTPDIQRLHKCFEHIAMGLFFHDYGHTFSGKIHLISAFLHSQDKDYEILKAFIKEKEPSELIQQRRGSNPQWGQPDLLGLFTLKLCFYENVTVYASFQKDSIDIENSFLYKIAQISDSIQLTVNEKVFSFSKEFIKKHQIWAK